MERTAAGNQMVIGFGNGPDWRWVRAGNEESPTILAATARALTDDDELILVVDNYRIRDFVAANPGLVTNPEALDTLGPDDDAANPSILVCRLK